MIITKVNIIACCREKGCPHLPVLPAVSSGPVPLQYRDSQKPALYVPLIGKALSF